MKLLKPLYGLCESGDLWYQTLANFCKNDLKLKTIQSDPARRYLKQEKTLRGICGAFVDNLLSAGDNVFKKRMESTKPKC